MWEDLADKLVTLGKATAIVSVCSGLPLLVLFFILGRPRPFWPPYRNRAISWGGGRVLAAFLVCLILVPFLIQISLSRERGAPPQPEHLLPQSQDAGVIPSQVPSNPVFLLWLAVLAFPFQIIALWILFHFPRTDRLYQLGLTGTRMWPDILRGWSAWLILSISVNVLNALISIFIPSEDHDLVKIAEQHPLVREWVLIFCAAMLTAPVMEELLFRGILQGWLMKRPQGIPFVYLLTLLLALFLRGDQAMSAVDARDWKAFLYQLEPAGFVLLFLPFFARKSSTSGAYVLPPRGRVIVTSSLIFAIAHATVWPTPIPLFFFALGLGWLAWRTQSIVPGIVAHSLFNAVACVQLLSLPIKP